MITDEEAGQLLRKLAEVERGQERCEEQNEEIKGELQATRSQNSEIMETLGEMKANLAKSQREIHRLTKSQQDDEDAKKRVYAWWTLAKLLGTIATVVCLPIAGWTGSQAWDHYQHQVDRIDRVRDLARSTNAELSRHVESPGHEANRTAIQTNARSIAAIQTRLSTIEQQQRAIAQTQTEILRAVRRPRTRGE